MTYIDHIAPVRATGPASAAGPRPTGTDRLLPAWAMGTLACPPVNPFGTTSNHQHPTTPKESG